MSEVPAWAQGDGWEYRPHQYGANKYLNIPASATYQLGPKARILILQDDCEIYITDADDDGVCFDCKSPESARAIADAIIAGIS